MDCLVGWSLTKCIPHAVRHSAGRRMKPILRAAPRVPCNEPATGKGSAKLHAASSHADRTSLQQVIVYRRTRTPPSIPRRICQRPTPDREPARPFSQARQLPTEAETLLNLSVQSDTRPPALTTCRSLCPRCWLNMRKGVRIG